MELEPWEQDTDSSLWPGRPKDSFILFSTRARARRGARAPADVYSASLGVMEGPLL